MGKTMNHNRQKTGVANYDLLKRLASGVSFISRFDITIQLSRDLGQALQKLAHQFVRTNVIVDF